MNWADKFEGAKRDPLKPFSRGFSFCYGVLLSRKRNIRIGSRLKLDGIPLVDIKNDAFLDIGEGVTLTSRNRGYHLNLHSPVKLFADRSKARISIGNHTRVHGSCIHAYEYIEIGARCLIAANCQIMDGSGHDASFKQVENRVNTTGKTKPVIIEDDVWLGTGAIILPGVRIGKGSIIGAGSVVSKDVPPRSLAAGVPARIVQR